MLLEPLRALERDIAGVNIPVLEMRSWDPLARSPVLAALHSLQQWDHCEEIRIGPICILALNPIASTDCSLGIQNMFPLIFIFASRKEERREQNFLEDIVRVASEGRSGPGETQHWETIFCPHFSPRGTLRLLFKLGSTLYNLLTLWPLGNYLISLGFN